MRTGRPKALYPLINSVGVRFRDYEWSEIQKYRKRLGIDNSKFVHRAVIHFLAEEKISKSGIVVKFNTNPKKVGRPLMKQGQAHTILAGARFSKSEWETISYAIQRSSLDKSKWIRRACLQQSQREKAENYAQ